MSLILEALRKSEAERQRGMPPRLDSPMLRPIRRRQKLAPGLALLVLGVPVAGWFVYRGMGPEVDTASEATVGDVALQSLNEGAAPLAPAGVTLPDSITVRPADDPTTTVDESAGPTFAMDGNLGTRMGFVFARTDIALHGETATDGAIGVLRAEAR